ncbi:hypothetical protein GGI12_003087 [Dipsacomyces acuminosporus]|nr:hypothetical protein GGI12_003087 [Dipsacomyces acuminosporus]
MEAPLSEHMDFLPHGYAKDTVFRFKNPLVTDILQNDINAKQCDFTLVSDAKASIKGAASSRSDDSHPGSRGRGRSGSGSGRSSSTSPAIGGLRRLMKRTHTPEGLVTYYENRLRAFLDLDSNADSTDGRASETDGNQQNGSAAGPCSSAGDSDWQIIDEDEGMFTPMDRDQLIEEDDMVVLTQALAKIEQSPSRPSPAIKAGINQNLVTEWAIPDSFTRLIVHTMCRYYGLVSFSENAADGENVLHICHPRFFKDAETISVPDVTFHQFLYNSN